MKNTKENVIKLLQKMYENSKAVQKIFEESGDKESAEFYTGEKLALYNVMSLLQDSEYFNTIWDVFNQ